jgi:ATP-binding cassette subfamily B protein
VRDADVIFVLRHGRIVERGTHDVLVARGGLYAAMHRQQMLEQEIGAI